VAEVAPRIDVVEPARAEAFFAATEREALGAAYGFPVVWHARRYALVAIAADGTYDAALDVLVAASLATVERVVVVPERRRLGRGRALLERAEILASYLNCHKVTAAVPVLGGALAFFEACDYRIEATLVQHTFKRDVALVRKFLL